MQESSTMPPPNASSCAAQQNSRIKHDENLCSNDSNCHMVGGDFMVVIDVNAQVHLVFK
jgi:hypothetical protein